MFNKYDRVRGSKSRLPLNRSVVSNCGGALSHEGPARGEGASTNAAALGRVTVSDAVRLARTSGEGEVSGISYDG